VTRQQESLNRKLRNALIAAVFVVMIPVWLPVVLVSFVLYGAVRLLLHFLIVFAWLPTGKDMLLVYSDSPIWHDYMTANIIPLVKDRAVILNSSERKKWRRYSLPVVAFRLIGGYRNFNPLVIHFRPLRPSRSFRFWPAFKEWKQGRPEPVEELRRQLQAVVRSR
jgi:hypothetical protein